MSNEREEVLYRIEVRKKLLQAMEYAHEGKNFEAAERLLQDVIHCRDSKLMYQGYMELGEIYKEKEDYETAEKYYRIALESDDPQIVQETYYWLAQMYEKQSKMDLAFQYLKKAAECGDADAAYKLGMMYGFGCHVEKDHDQARYWYLKWGQLTGKNPTTELSYLDSGTQQPGSPIEDPQDTPAKSKHCYVATAVYGSYDCPQVWTLRRFRDECLDQKWYGRGFIRLYYAVSPTAIRWFGETEWFRHFFRSGLDRLVNRLRKAGYSDRPYMDR